MRDAREVRSAKKLETNKKSSFPKITFKDTKTSGNTTVRSEPKDIMKTTQTQRNTNNAAKTTQTLEQQNTTTATQKPDRSKNTAEICVSRVELNICVQEEWTHNVEPTTMGPTTQLEASLDTPLFRQRLNEFWVFDSLPQPTRKMRPLINFVKKRDWEANKVFRRSTLKSYAEQASCPGGLPNNSRKNRHSFTNEADSARQSPYDTSGIGSNVELK